MRCRRFWYMHAEETFPAVREDAFGAFTSLRSQLLINLLVHNVTTARSLDMHKRRDILPVCIYYL